MSIQVQRLEELLTRVQRNRSKPRIVDKEAASQRNATSHREAAVLSQVVEPLPIEPEKSPATVPTSKAKKPSPMEIAMEGHLNQPAVKPMQSIEEGPEIVADVEITAETGSFSESVRQSHKPPAPTQASPDRRRVDAMERAQSDESIVEVVSQPSPLKEPTFGELLARTLSLRSR